jgi:hypothetical protein
VGSRYSDRSAMAGSIFVARRLTCWRPTCWQVDAGRGCSYHKARGAYGFLHFWSSPEGELG